MKTTLLAAALGASSTLVFGLGAWALAVSAPVTDVTARDLEELRAEVAAVRAGIARLEERARPDMSLAAWREPDPRGARASAGSDRELQALRADLEDTLRDAATLAAELEGLRVSLVSRTQEVLALARAATATPGASLAQALKDKPQPDLSALESLALLAREDRQAGLAAVRFLTPPELLARFGPPSLVTGDDEGETRWEYRWPGAFGGGELCLGLRLRDGFVCSLSVRSTLS